MATRDLHNHIKVSRAISPVSVADNTAQVSEIIDTAGYESLELVILTGTLGDAAATFTVLLEDGDDPDLGDDGAAVADTFLLGTEAAASFDQADDDTTFKLGYVGSKRYVRATITPADNATASLLAACWVQSHARHQPVA